MDNGPWGHMVHRLAAVLSLDFLLISYDSVYSSVLHKKQTALFFFYSHLLSVPQMPNDFETTAEPSGQLTHTQADEHD